MAKNTQNEEGISSGYGRNRTVTTTTLNGTTTTCSSEKMGIRVIKGSGMINSMGVTPDGSTCSLISTQAEVDFTLDIYKKGNSYQGDIYIVSYDTRKKISSNRLIYYQRVEEEEALCIFCVQYQSGCTNASYELIISVSPTNCSACSAGEFYAYAAPIYNEGVNIGGQLKTGEIIFYNTTACN